MSFDTLGFEVVKNFLNKTEVDLFRDVLDKFLQNEKSFKTNGARIVPGFAGRTPLLGQLNTLHTTERMKKTIANFFGEEEEFIFLDHSDLHQNQMTDWHRDTGDYQKGGGDLNEIWNPQCKILKACILLQDHIDNDKGLWFQPGTHTSNRQSTAIHAPTESTDLIVFDQRIAHRGQVGLPRYHEIYGKNRYLITYAFGVNNRYSEIHRRGAARRQNEQRTYMS